MGDPSLYGARNGCWLDACLRMQGCSQAQGEIVALFERQSSTGGQAVIAALIACRPGAQQRLQKELKMLRTEPVPGVHALVCLPPQPASTILLSAAKLVRHTTNL